MVEWLSVWSEVHMAQLTLPPLTVSYFSKIQIVLPFWYRLTQVVLDKGLLIGGVCVKLKVLLIQITIIIQNQCRMIRLLYKRNSRWKQCYKQAQLIMTSSNFATCSLAAIITDTRGHTWTQLVTRVLRIKFAANGFRTARTLYEILTGVTITKKVSRQSRHFNNLQQFTCKLSSL